MKTIILILSLTCMFLSATMVQAQELPTKRTPNRDLRLEQAIFARYDTIAKSLQPEAKLRLAHVSLVLLNEVVRGMKPADLEQIAHTELNKNFTRLTTAQTDVLTFWALADVAQYAVRSMDGGNKKSNMEEAKEQVKDKLDSLSEMGEMESLRLQMAMDRVSKFMTTLSNLLKKMSDTSSSLVQNLK